MSSNATETTHGQNNSTEIEIDKTKETLENLIAELEAYRGSRISH